MTVLVTQLPLSYSVLVYQCCRLSMAHRIYVLHTSIHPWILNSDRSAKGKTYYPHICEFAPTSSFDALRTCERARRPCGKRTE